MFSSQPLVLVAVCMAVSVNCWNASPKFKVDVEVPNPTGLSSARINGSDLDKDSLELLNESLKKALTKFSNPIRIDDLEIEYYLTINYKEVDIYGFKELFVSSGSMKKSENGNILLTFRLKNRKGFFMKSKGTSSGDPKEDEDYIGSFIAEGRDYRPLDYLLEVNVDPKTGKVTDPGIIEPFETKVRINLITKDIRNRQRIITYSQYWIQVQLSASLRSLVYDIVDLMELQALIPVFKRFQSM